MSKDNIKILEINRKDSKARVKLVLNIGNTNSPPKLELEFHKKGKSHSIRELFTRSTNGYKYYFERKDVEDIIGMMREYEALYDGWADSKEGMALEEFKT